MSSNEIMEGLKAPFSPEDIEWKTQSATERDGKISVLVVPYLDARAIMDRLDKVCGPLWKTEFHQMTVQTDKGPKQGFSCILSIKIGDEWVTRVDGAEVSDIESIKGGHSNALKRAAVQWGIGRYLYDLPNFWVPVGEQGNSKVYGNFKIKGKQRQVSGKFNAPRLDKKFLPDGYVYSNKKNSNPAPPAQNHEDTVPNSNSNGNRNQQPNQGQSRQQPNQNGSQTPGNKPSSQATKSPLEHTISLLRYLKVPKKYVPSLFQRVVGEALEVGKASEKDLKALYKALNPVKTYMEYCNKQGLAEDEMLYYAQITLKEKLDNHMNLFLKMDNLICNETMKLIHEDRKAIQPA